MHFTYDDRTRYAAYEEMHHAQDLYLNSTIDRVLVVNAVTYHSIQRNPTLVRLVSTSNQELSGF